MAEFVAIFYAVWFLRTAVSFAAPNQDLTAYWQMHQYKQHVEHFDPNAESHGCIDAVFTSMNRHTWYLQESLVPIALVDPDLPDEERSAIANKLLSIPSPGHFMRI